LKVSSAKFAHNSCFEFENKNSLVSSYHTSRYNIQTKRLTKSMFTDVFKTIEYLLARS
jgi:uracil-DNA glycosylase